MRKTYVATAAGALALLLAACMDGTGPTAAKQKVTTVSADLENDGCPASGTGNPQTSDRVSATATQNGNDVTYTFQSLVTETSVDLGVPGLIKYCVYSDALPDDPVAVVATGANGAAWTDPPGDGVWAFSRPDGNPSNIPYDGLSHTMGTATWTNGVAANFDKILLHINDPAECDRLYGGNPGTCFVLPGGGTTDEADDLSASKTADGAYDNTYTWTIDKSVDKTTVKQIGGSATFNYTVKVEHGTASVSNVKVTGKITVSNPNGADADISGITDQLSDATNCTVTGTFPATIPANGSQDFTYSCDLASLPSSGIGNLATVSWGEQTLSDDTHLDAGSANAPYPLNFPTSAIVFTGNDIDECVDVTDTHAGTLGTVCVGDDNPKEFKYQRIIAVPATDCVSYDNTATFTTNDSETSDDDSQTVTVCGPARTGALTIGFWKTTNGQALIGTYCGTDPTGLGAYLRGLGGGSGPFSTAPSACNSLKTYVLGVLNAASATNMNAMLKAQMLGTALDVWFSGAGWTSTKIGGTKPPSQFLSHNNLGTFKMDLTAVCPMVDNTTTGTASCLNNTPSTDAVASGAVASSPLSMQAILNFAATTTTPFNAGVWYAGNRTKQEILKNIFDQFNNQLAFGSF